MGQDKRRICEREGKGIMEIIDYLTRKGLIIRQSGKEYLTDCPYCKKEKHLSVNNEKGVWRCLVCAEAGNIWKLRKFYGDINIQQIIKPPQKEYKLPARNKDQIYQKALMENKQALNYLQTERGFLLETIKRFRLGYNEGIAIPYYQDSVLRNFKVRKIDGKDYLREKDCKSTLYNIDNLNKSEPVIIVEGEFDCIAATQMGYENVISVPNGAGAFDNEWIDILENVGEVYLVFDNDEIGEKGAHLFAKKIGVTRCKRVLLPFKDFNECLMAGYTKQELDKYFQEAKEYKPKGIVHVSEVLANIEELWKQGDKLKGVQIKEWKQFNEVLGGIRMREVTALTGETASGKTAFSLYLIYKLLLQNRKCLIISSEITKEDILSRLFSVICQKSFYLLQRDEIYKGMKFFGGKDLFFVDTEGKINIKEIREYLEYAHLRYDVEFVLLDHLHFFLPPGSDRQVADIEEFMRGVVRSALKLHIHIWLIVHPHKLRNDTGKVQLNDLKGGSCIKQDAFNVGCLWRDREKEKDSIYKVWLDFQKVRSPAGLGGNIELEFNPVSQIYTEV